MRLASGQGDATKELADKLDAGLEAVRARAAKLPRHPKVFFEEWHEPLISGIAWVSELVEIAGGRDIFAERSSGKSAKERIVARPRDLFDPDCLKGEGLKRNLVFITGPSATADMGPLVHGVHGPHRLLVLLLE